MVVEVALLVSTLQKEGENLITHVALVDDEAVDATVGEVAGTY